AGDLDGVPPPLSVGDDAAVVDPTPPTRRRSGDDHPSEAEVRRRGVRLVATAALLVAIAGAAVWWFGVRTPTHEVPNLVGTPVAAAARAAAASEWRVDRATLVRRDGTRPGEVVGQSPRAGAQLAEGATLRLVVSLGSSLVPLPGSVVGQSIDAARAQVRSAGLRPGSTATQPDERLASGLVVSIRSAVTPNRNGEVPKGTVVTFVLSSGPAPRTLPATLIGLQPADAQRQLERLRLRVRRVDAFDPKVPFGLVAALQPAVGSKVARDSVVTMVVSKGPARVPVPNVAGRPADQAVAALRAARFPVAAVDGPPNGTVVATIPAAGTVVPSGSPIRVVTRP
ncbi:MAG: PASTA domain-containing protein, partial [Actinomycetes bacterium]